MSHWEAIKKQALKGAAEAQYVKDLSATKEVRNSYTLNFLRERLPSSVKPEAFIVRACKALNIEPSKDMLTNVINIQRALGFPEIPKNSRSERYGFAEYIDGKLGPRTRKHLLQHEKGKSLKTIFPEYQKAKRQDFAKKSGLPTVKTKKPTATQAPTQAPAAGAPAVAKAPKTPSAPKQHPEIQGKAKRVAYVADSNGGKWFLGRHLNTINNRPTLKLVKGGMGSRWGRNKIRANLARLIKEKVTDVVLMLGTNDMSTWASLYYTRRPVEKDPTVKNYIRMREMLRKKGIRLHICTIPPLGGYIARKYRQRRERLSGPRAAYWRTKYWENIPRGYKRRYKDPIAFYTAAEQACYTRWTNVNHWIMAQQRHINLGNAETVTLSKRKSSDGIHMTGVAEQRRMAKRIKDRFS